MSIIESSIRTMKDTYSLPRINDSMYALVCSSLDLKSVNHQILIVSRDRNTTAFSSPWGMYEFRIMFSD